MRLNFLVSSSGIRKGGPLGFLSVCARNKNNSLVGSVCLVVGLWNFGSRVGKIRRERINESCNCYNCFEFWKLLSFRN